MKRVSWVSVLLIITISLFTADPSQGEMPTEVVYQGTLVDRLGEPLSGTYELTFRLYDQPTGGTQLWQEIKALVANQGYVSTFLGDRTALPPYVFQQKTYLSVSVGSDSEMLPRIQFSQVPFAARSNAVGNRMLWVGGEATAQANGDELRAAVTFLGTQILSAENPWVIHLEAGIFDLGSSLLTLPDHIKLSGSGKGISIIRTSAQTGISPCSHCRLQDFTLEYQPSLALTNTAIGGTVDGLTLEDLEIKVTSDNSSLHYALDLTGASNFRMLNVDVNLELTGVNSRAGMRPVRLGGLSGDSLISSSKIVAKADGGSGMALNVSGAGLSIQGLEIEFEALYGQSWGIIAYDPDFLDFQDINITMRAYRVAGILITGGGSTESTYDLADIKMDLRGPFMKGIEVLQENTSVGTLALRDIVLNSYAVESAEIPEPNESGNTTWVYTGVFQATPSASLNVAVEDSDFYSEGEDGSNAQGLMFIDANLGLSNSRSEARGASVIVESRNKTNQASLSQSFLHSLGTAMFLINNPEVTLSQSSVTSTALSNFQQPPASVLSCTANIWRSSTAASFAFYESVCP